MTVSQECLDTRTHESNMCSMFSRCSPSLKHGPSPTCVPPAQECLESRPKESEHPCDFPESDPSQTAVVRLRRHSSARVDVPTARHFFAVQTKESDTCVQAKRDLESQRHEKINAWICALPTIHYDLASVILDNKKEKRKRTEVFFGLM